MFIRQLTLSPGHRYGRLLSQEPSTPERNPHHAGDACRACRAGRRKNRRRRQFGGPRRRHAARCRTGQITLIDGAKRATCWSVPRGGGRRPEVVHAARSAGHPGRRRASGVPPSCPISPAAAEPADRRQPAGGREPHRRIGEDVDIYPFATIGDDVGDRRRARRSTRRAYHGRLADRRGHDHLSRTPCSTKTPSSGRGA